MKKNFLYFGLGVMLSLGIVSVVAFKQNEPRITGLGEIRFDRPLKECLHLLEQTAVFDSSCEAITGEKKAYQNTVYNPCLLAFKVAPYVDGVNWQLGYVFYTPSGRLVDIFIFEADSSLGVALEMKYGIPESSRGSFKLWKKGDIWLSVDSKSGNIRISDQKILGDFDACKKETIRRLKEKCKSQQKSPIDINKL